MVCAALLCQPLVDRPALRFVVEIEMPDAGAVASRTMKEWRSPLRSMAAASGDGGQRERRRMMFTIEFFRIRKEDNAHAMLDRITHIASDLESAKVKAKSLFDTLNMPQNPDGLRILDQNGHEVFFWTPRTEGS
jgi:hypothetical protein